MRKILPLIFALSLNGGSVLAWGWQDCPYSKQGTNQEDTKEKVQNTESSKRDK